MPGARTDERVHACALRLRSSCDNADGVVIVLGDMVGTPGFLVKMGLNNLKSNPRPSIVPSLVAQLQAIPMFQIWADFKEFAQHGTETRRCRLGILTRLWTQLIAQNPCFCAGDSHIGRGRKI